MKKIEKTIKEYYELYDITRGCWRVNKEKAQKAKYAFAVYDGIVLEVYKIVQWFKAGEVMWTTRDENIDLIQNRYEFVGNIAPDNIRKKYINKSVASLFTKGSQNPIKYFLIRYKTFRRLIVYTLSQRQNYLFVFLLHKGLQGSGD